MRRALLFAVLACAAWAQPASADTGYSRPAQFGTYSVKDVSVKMSDGVVLEADVYYPSDPATGAPAGGKFPVVLAQTPYGKRSVTTTQGFGEYGGDGYFPYLVKRGYINAIVDVRGTGSSQGKFGLFSKRDARDGAELVRWAAGLERSSGKVGAAGYSYVGLNQIFTAAQVGKRSPLKAIVPSAAGIDLYRDLAFGGGIPNGVFAAGWSGLRSSMITAPPDDPGKDPLGTVLGRVDRARGFAELDAGLYTEIEQGGPRAYDGSFWRSRRPGAYLKRVVRNRVPALMITGWFDVYQRGVLLNYTALQNAFSGRPLFGPMRPRQRATPRYQIVQGPWFHNPVGMGEWIGQIHLEWFDRWLRGQRTRLTSTSRPLHAYELGGGRWIDAGAYPLALKRVRKIYLGGGALSSRRSSGSFDRLPWTPAASPCNRHPDQWSTGFGGLISAWAGQPVNPCHKDDRTTAVGALTYTTKAFTRDTTLAGPISAGIRLASSTSDSTLVATLQDIGPDGGSYPLTTGALLGSLRKVDRRASWRHGGKLVLPVHPYTRASRRSLTPGRVETHHIEVPPVFARLRKGHRLRLTLSTSVSHLMPTAAQLPSLVGGVYEVHRGSFVNLPLAPSSRLPSAKRNWGDCNGQC